MPDQPDRKDMLTNRDVTGLARLLTAHPELATAPLEREGGCGGEDPLGYITMLRFNHGRLGLPGDLTGTGAIAKLLIEAGARVNGLPGAQETPLITAASYGDAEVARVLIEAGADLEAMSSPESGGVPGGSALLHAAVFSMTEVVDVLVAAGASVRSLELAAAAGDISGWPVGRCTPQSRLRALVFAADHERLEVIDQLIAAGTPVNEADAEWGRLALHTAAGNGRAASVRRLLSHGADPELRDPIHGQTALDECLPPRAPADSEPHAQVAVMLREAASHHPGDQPDREPAGIQIRIEGSGLPGRDCDAAPGVPGHRNVHVAVQRRGKPGELLDPQPGDAARAVWVFHATVREGADGPDVTGPYIQGGPGGRFIYLSWGAVDEAGTFTMFRRAKLMLDAIDPAAIEGARRYGRLIARLTLTDRKGGPLCAAVRPPLITWTAESAG